jgi:hypothetical protein
MDSLKEIGPECALDGQFGESLGFIWRVSSATTLLEHRLNANLYREGLASEQLQVGKHFGGNLVGNPNFH